MGFPIEFVEGVGTAELPVRLAAREERRRCLHCGYELMGPLAERMSGCPQCGREFSVWAMSEVRPLPNWVMTAWLLSPALLPLAMPAASPVRWDRVEAVWTLPVLGVLVLYFWGCRLLRERRVPLWGMFAVPVAAFAALPVGLLALLMTAAVQSGRPEAPALAAAAVGVPVFALCCWVLRRERCAVE